MAVVKTIDLVGVSSESWRHAAREALAEAAKTLRGIEAMDVLETSCTIENNETARNVFPTARSANGIYCFNAPNSVIRNNRTHEV